MAQLSLSLFIFLSLLRIEIRNTALQAKPRNATERSSAKFIDLWEKNMWGERGFSSETLITSHTQFLSKNNKISWLNYKYFEFINETIIMYYVTDWLIKLYISEYFRWRFKIAPITDPNILFQNIVQFSMLKLIILIH